MPDSGVSNKNFKKWIAPTFLIVVVLVVGFGAGAWWERASASKPPVPSTSASGVTSIFGLVTAMSSNTITLRLSDGSMRLIILASTTGFYAAPVSTTSNTVTTGSMISAVVPISTSNALVAQSINIVPPPPPPPTR